MSASRSEADNRLIKSYEDTIIRLQGELDLARQNYNCPCDHPSQCNGSCAPKYQWTEVGIRTEGDRWEYYREQGGEPVQVLYSYPESYVHRLKDALEGECDGLAIDDEQAHKILKWVLFEKE